MFVETRQWVYSLFRLCIFSAQCFHYDDMRSPLSCPSYSRHKRNDRSSPDVRNLFKVMNDGSFEIKKSNVLPQQLFHVLFIFL